MTDILALVGIFGDRQHETTGGNLAGMRVRTSQQLTDKLVGFAEITKANATVDKYRDTNNALYEGTPHGKYQKLKAGLTYRLGQRTTISVEAVSSQSYADVVNKSRDVLRFETKEQHGMAFAHVAF